MMWNWAAFWSNKASAQRSKLAGVQYVEITGREVSRSKEGGEGESFPREPWGGCCP